MLWALLACAGEPEPALRGPDPAHYPTLFAAGRGERPVQANPFLGRLVEGRWEADPRDLASPTVATTFAAAFERRRGLHGESVSEGRVTVDVVDVRRSKGVSGERLIDLAGGEGTTLIWNNEAPIERLRTEAVPEDAVNQESRQALLETVYELDAQHIECKGASERWDTTVVGHEPARSVEGHALVHWDLEFTREGKKEETGRALFLETGGPVRSSATAPYLKLCGKTRPIDARADLPFRVGEGPPLVLVEVRCTCDEWRFVILDLELAEAVLWSW